MKKGLANQNDDDEEEEGENQTIQEQEKDIVDGIKDYKKVFFF